MRALPLLLSLLCSSCIEVSSTTRNEGSAANPYEGLGIDPAFHSYVQEFEKIWGKQASSVVMAFVDYYTDNDGTVGVCWPEHYPRVLTINRQYWDTTDDKTTREILMFHEMGHCLLGLDHDESTDEEGNPTSIMYPSIDPVVESYKANRDEFLGQLFSQPSDPELVLDNCQE